MTLENIKNLKVLMTRAIGVAVEENADTTPYLMSCLKRVYSGDYGELKEEDIDANNTELKNGVGRLVCRYKKAHGLNNDIYIIAIFNSDIDINNLDYNHIMIMYVNEY